MKKWQETTEVFRRMAEARRVGRRQALAVVHAVQGSAYRRPGAKFLVDEDGRWLGNVSGGCLEEDLRETALDILTSDRARVVHYDTSDDEDTVWGLGLGCGGQVDLVVFPTSDLSDQDVSDVVRRLDGEETFRLVFSLEEASTRRMLVMGEPSETRPSGDQDTFTDVLVPPPQLVICGAGDDAIPLARYAEQAGLRVTVVDHRAAYLHKDRFPSARACLHRRAEDGVEGLPVGADVYVVVMTHAVGQDRGWVVNYSGTPVPYVGLLGPRGRMEDIGTHLDETGRAKLYGPVGLDMGGEGREQVSVSILAEILTLCHNRTPRHLRDRGGSIHDHPA